MIAPACCASIDVQRMWVLKQQNPYAGNSQARSIQHQIWPWLRISCTQTSRYCALPSCRLLSHYDSHSILQWTERIRLLRHIGTCSDWRLAAGQTTTAGALPGNQPGGEREIAARVKHEGRSANVKLGKTQANFTDEQTWPGTPRDLEEKERYPCAPAQSTRGSWHYERAACLPRGIRFLCSAHSTMVGVCADFVLDPMERSQLIREAHVMVLASRKTKIALTSWLPALQASQHSRFHRHVTATRATCFATASGRSRLHLCHQRSRSSPPLDVWCERLHRPSVACAVRRCASRSLADTFWPGLVFATRLCGSASAHCSTTI